MSKILIVRTGGLGDILHAVPVAAGIRAALPEATIGWLVAARWAELLAAPGSHDQPHLSPQKPLVNFVHAIKPRSQGSLLRPGVPAEILRRIRGLRKIGYDVALNFENTWKSALATALGAIPRRAGFQEARTRFFYTQKLPQIGRAHV